MGIDDENDENLRIAVTEQLSTDREVIAREIAIAVSGGVVTLRGTAASAAARRAAEEDAKAVYGILGVDNRINVSADTAGSEDADLRANVLQALMSGGLAPQDLVVEVEHGWVHLSGTVTEPKQIDEAERTVARVLRVRGITNGLRLGPRAKPVVGGVQHSSKTDASPSGFTHPIEMLARPIDD